MYYSGSQMSTTVQLIPPLVIESTNNGSYVNTSFRLVFAFNLDNTLTSHFWPDVHSGGLDIQDEYGHNIGFKPAPICGVILEAGESLYKEVYRLYSMPRPRPNPPCECGADGPDDHSLIIEIYYTSNYPKVIRGFNNIVELRAANQSIPLPLAAPDQYRYNDETGEVTTWKFGNSTNENVMFNTISGFFRKTVVDNSYSDTLLVHCTGNDGKYYLILIKYSLL